MLSAGKSGDCGGVIGICGAVKLRQALMAILSWLMVILSSGTGSKILPRMQFKSSDNGRIVFKKLGFLENALYVESSVEACFHGLRPQVRLTSITPRDQMSLGADRYDGLAED